MENQLINDKENFKKLSAPIEISVRQFDNNKYIENSKVTERLNEVFGLNWNFELISKEVNFSNNEIYVICRLHYPTENGMKFKDAAGGSWYESKLNVGNGIKSCMSKALVKAASLIGITVKEVPPEPISEEQIKMILSLTKQLGIVYSKEQKYKLSELTSEMATTLIKSLEEKVN